MRSQGSDALVRPDASPLADENAGPEASVSLAKT